MICLLFFVFLMLQVGLQIEGGTLNLPQSQSKLNEATKPQSFRGFGEITQKLYVYLVLAQGVSHQKLSRYMGDDMENKKSLTSFYSLSTKIYTNVFWEFICYRVQRGEELNNRTDLITLLRES